MWIEYIACFVWYCHHRKCYLTLVIPSWKWEAYFDLVFSCWIWWHHVLVDWKGFYFNKYQQWHLYFESCILCVTDWWGAKYLCTAWFSQVGSFAWYFEVQDISLCLLQLWGASEMHNCLRASCCVAQLHTSCVLFWIKWFLSMWYLSMQYLWWILLQWFCWKCWKCCRRNLFCPNSSWISAVFQN